MVRMYFFIFLLSHCSPANVDFISEPLLGATAPPRVRVSLLSIQPQTGKIWHEAIDDNSLRSGLHTYHTQVKATEIILPPSDRVSYQTARMLRTICDESQIMYVDDDDSWDFEKCSSHLIEHFKSPGMPQGAL